jgi:1-acyl-sn-glycerol-3-phosphate acyltransferase
MRCFEFIFLSRKWDIDRPRIISSLESAKKDGCPMWLLLFPEGTVITQNTRSIADAFAKKSDIVFNAKHVILPRSTGLFHILRCLEEKSEYLYDFTIGYSGLKSTSIPFDEYPIDKVFFEGAGPDAIHIHVDRFKLSEIPGLSLSKYDPLEKPNSAFEEWLRARFLEKDQLLEEFFATGKFPEKAKSCKSGILQRVQVSRKTQDWITICGLVVASLTSLSWLFFY